MSIIKGSDTVMDVFTKISKGNPGALSALMDIFKNAEAIDPQCFGGGLIPILNFDTYGIYGTDIYILYNDQCKRDVRELLMLMRATQLGFFSEVQLRAIAGDQMGRELLNQKEMDDLDAKVMQELPEFQPRNIEEAA